MANPAATKATFDALRDQLQFARTGRFYKLNGPLTAAKHKKLVELVKQAHVSKEAQALSGLSAPEAVVYRSKNLASHRVQSAIVDAFGTLYIQPVLWEPAMATAAAPLRELRFAHVLILEGAVKHQSGKHGQWYAFVSRDILEDPLSFERRGVAPLSRAEILNPFLASSIPRAAKGRIEELSMRMMNISRVGTRRKVVEAYDVEASVSSLGLHRTIPGTLKIRLPRDEGVGTVVTVSSSRQSVRAGSSRVKLATLTEWFEQCVQRLDAEQGKATLQNKFLSEMASPLDTLHGLVPTSLLLDYATLEEEGFGGSFGWHASKKSPAAWRHASFIDDAFAEPVALAPKPVVAGGVGGARVAVNQSTTPAAVRSFVGSVPDGKGGTVAVTLEVEEGTCRLVPPAGSPFGTVRSSNKAMPFEQLVNRARALRVAFDGGRVLYAAEGAHQSGNLKLAVDRLLGAMTAVPALAGVVSEKGHATLKSSDTKFPKDSSFWVIENFPPITGPRSTLVCGDAKEEVFDYLEISHTEQRLRWLHAKVQGKTQGGAPVAMSQSQGSLSASSLQEVVGQAIKNLAFLRRDPTDPTFASEVARWTQLCTLPHPAKIKRLRRGKNAGKEVSAIVENALARHEVAIVIPTYSRSRLDVEFNKIQLGAADQHTIQLFWLLSGFTHACLEVGVVPMIFLRD